MKKKTQGKTKLPRLKARQLIHDPRARRRRICILIFTLAVLCSAAGGYEIWRRRLGEEALYQAGEAAWQRGQYAEAVREFERLLSRYPAGTLAQKGRMEAGNIYCYYLRNANRAIELYRAYLDRSRDREGRLAVRRNLADVYMRDVADLQQAIEEYKALREESSDPKVRQEASFHIAEAHFKKSEMEQALDEYDAVIRNNVDGHLRDKAYLRQGNIYQLMRQVPEAESAFKAVYFQTKCAECRYQGLRGLIDSLEKQEKYDEAMKIIVDAHGEPALEAMKAREIARITEKRGVLQGSSAVDWKKRAAQGIGAKE